MKGYDFSAVGSLAEQFDMLFADKELTLLVLWAIISPAAGIGYLIWIKYPKLRLVALLAFAVGLMQLYTNFGAFSALLKGIGIVF
ncbi:MAG: hypothetical protein V1835_06930 [Candidatus Micrarchaeota archaeon]